jgi:hypothetical protein
MPVLTMDCPFWTVSIQVADRTPQAAGRLLAIGSDVTKHQAVVALRKGVLGSLRLYLEGDVAEAGQFEYFLGFVCLG